MNPTVHRYEHKAMATLFELLILTKEEQLGESAAYAVFQRVDALEQLLSRFLDVSEVAMIAQLKPGQTFRVVPDTMNLLLAATQVCAATNGAFDVTVGPVMDALRPVKNRWAALTKEELDDALARCGMNRLVLDPEHQLVSVKPDRLGRDTPVELDFGAIGKGYALDVASEMLSGEWEFTDFLMHGGTSTVVAKGSMGDGREGWPVNVGGDWRARAGLDAIRLTGGALSGSGFEVKGAHVIDVRRGAAAARHPAVWSYAPNATLADALSTAWLGLDWKEIKSACEAIPGSGALIARDQAEWMDKVRSPVRTIGVFPGGKTK
jgi:thiamine biosynthesis lipoprotein